MSGLGGSFSFPPEAVEAIARRAAELVLERLELDERRNSDRSPWLTVPEAAELLRCKSQRIYEMRTDGRISPHREGGRAVVSRAEIERLVSDS